MSQAEVRIRGARTHNLKGIDLDLPLGRLIVVAGVGGAGKSSLALDVLAAEGKRRYVETFSTHARRFLEPVEKPDVDRIAGLPPAVALDWGSRPSPRATAGSIAEVHDRLAPFFARRGEVRCLGCGDPVLPASPRTVALAIDATPEGTRYEIAFPVDVLPDTDLDALGRTLLERGTTRLRAGDRRIDLTTESLDAAGLDRGAPFQIDAIVDRLVRGRDASPRRLDSIETALGRGLGRCRILADSGDRTFVRGWRCGRCGVDHLEPLPDLFRWTSPLGACPRCEGLGVDSDPDSDGLPCPACRGARLRPEALAVRVGGLSVAEFSALSVDRARATLESWADADEPPDVALQRRRIAERLEALARIGLGHLPLDRPARELSTGELRRAAIVRALGTGLTGTLHVLDEPTVGLHPEDVAPVIDALRRLRDEGNTPIVVEHDADVILAADFVVELGPGAGDAGGSVVYSGPVAGLADAPGSITADFLTGRRRVPRPASRRAPAKGFLTLRGASGKNLKGIDAAFPLGVLCVVAGVGGSGKSALVEGTLYPAVREALGGGSGSPPALPFESLDGEGGLTRVERLDRSPLGRSGRTNPATYLKAFDEIRRVFAATHEARLRNYSAAKFSFNVEGGRCSACKGEGIRRVDMQFLPDVTAPCPDCKGTRYRPEVLEATFRGKSVAEVLDLTIRQAFGFFRNRPRIQSRLRPALDLGLDYLRLGQPAATLSGGEAQRLRLSAFLGGSTAALNRVGSDSRGLFILDEPTAGLHPADMVRLLEALSNLVDRGCSAIVVEHAPEVMVAADWIVELGPAAGDAGGRIVAEGTPEEVAKADTPTGRILAERLRR